MIDPEHKEWIRYADTPKIAARLGRSLPCRSDWEAVKVSIMKKAVLAKFIQHPELRKKLKETGSSYLVEHTVGSPRPDSIWGDGADGTGQNLLGKILMEVRDNT